MNKKPLTPKQTEALDLDKDGKAGGSMKQGVQHPTPHDHEPYVIGGLAPTPEEAQKALDRLVANGLVEPKPAAPLTILTDAEKTPPKVTLPAHATERVLLEKTPAIDPQALFPLPSSVGNEVPPTPTVARIVHFYSSKDEGPFAAIITGVHDDVVDLAVFHRAFILHRTDVPTADGLKGDGYHWVWPPRA